MKVLLICTKYSVQEGSSWLTDSLAEELAKEHEVVVICLDWAATHKHDICFVQNGVKVNMLAMDKYYFKGVLGKLVKWFFSARWKFRSVDESIKNERFDLVVNFSPALIMNYFARKLKKHTGVVYLVLWDFLPFYDFEFGVIPKFLRGVFKFFENRSFNSCNKIGLMSPENSSFILGNYRLKRTVSPEILPIWGPNSILPRDHASYLAARKLNDVADELVCVFGGQLVRGRGIGKLIELARFSKVAKIPARFFIFGDGPQRDLILKDIHENGISDIVSYKGWCPRDEYLNFLKGADLGLVFNSGAAIVPTFPSKTVDYLRAGVPVLAFVEDATDFGHILEGTIKSGWSSSPLTAKKLLEDFSMIAGIERKKLLEIGAQGQTWYSSNLAVDKVAARLLMSTKSNQF
jgi:glycosyltransferase involved in cell wall biosynthesis